ncbi:MAG: dihydropteroate synthase [Alphaproteobacteria bacterium]|nr:dihydropteroate synthase [Alphaproteobacteria bacterium]
MAALASPGPSPRPAASPLPARPLVVGILNVTPDSFFDGGRHDAVAAAIARARAMVDEGADWIDVGGESTRPGAAAVSVEDEIARTVPVVRAIRDLAPVSIDTGKAAVAAAALAAGASIVNDVTGLSDPDMPAVTADADATVVMHSRGTPRTMAGLTAYGDLVVEVRDFLLDRAALARSPQVWLDPGIGFAKTAAQSLALLRHLDVLVATGLPVYVGASRKSFIGQTLDQPDPGQRLVGSLAAAAAAVERGALALRVHDVAETRQLVELLTAVRRPATGRPA